MSSEVKLCIDCRYCIVPKHESIYDNAYLCGKTKNVKQSIITGLKNEYCELTCKQARDIPIKCKIEINGTISYFEKEYCGYNAKWFEPKEESK